jgi:hypothetical protein
MSKKLGYWVYLTTIKEMMGKDITAGLIGATMVGTTTDTSHTEPIGNTTVTMTKVPDTLGI